MVKVKNIANQINDIDFEKMAKQAKQVAQNACQTANKMAIKSLPYLETAAKWYLIAVLAVPAILLLIAYNVIIFLNENKKELLHRLVFFLSIAVMGIFAWFGVFVFLLFTP